MRGGRGLIKMYSSIEDMLRRVYPEHEWLPSRFIKEGRSPPGYWLDKESVKKALDFAEQQIGIQKVS